jgi:hypothetical protein
MRNDTVGERRTCVDCGADFVITVGECGFFVQRGLLLPRRCGVCRQQRKFESTQDTRDTRMARTGSDR